MDEQLFFLWGRHPRICSHGQAEVCFAIAGSTLPFSSTLGPGQDSVEFAVPLGEPGRLSPGSNRLLATFPDGRRMLVDCGSAMRGDAGGRSVVPFLRRSGARRIDVLVLTHPHEDHYGGAEAVLSSFDVGEIWVPAGIPREEFGPAVSGFAGTVRPVRSGDAALFGGVAVLARAPKERAEGKTNDRGIVLEFRFGILSLWLPGDLEGGPSSWGRPAPEAGTFRVLFLPHHGSPGASPSEWVAFCRPAATVAQKGDCFTGGNLVRSGQRFLLENGAFTVRSDGKGATFEQGSLPGFIRFLWRLT